MNHTRILDLSPVFSDEPKQPFVRVDFLRELEKVEELTPKQVEDELKWRYDREFFQDLKQE